MNAARAKRLSLIGLVVCPCGRVIWDFEAATAYMPNCLGGYDPMSHKTLADLAFMADTEIDNYLGGENFCDAPDIKTARQLREVRNYVSTLRHAIEGGCQ